MISVGSPIVFLQGNRSDVFVSLPNYFVRATRMERLGRDTGRSGSPTSSFVDLLPDRRR
jgi:hypothetical protein